MSTVILYTHPDYSGPYTLIETRDGERRKYTNTDAYSAVIRKQLQASDIQFVERRLDEGDCIEHRMPFGGKAFVVVEFNDDVCTSITLKSDHFHSTTGVHHKNFPSVLADEYDHGSLLEFLNS